MIKKYLLCVLPCISLVADQLDYLENAFKKLEEMLGIEQEESSFTCTSHTIKLSSGLVSYTAVTGTLPQYANDGTIAGNIFFTAYLKDPEETQEGAEDGQNRPVTFIFNGGPGGSCLSMHIGGLGPRRVLFPEEGQKPFPPFQLVDNEQTILDMTDLVMVDPIGTGFSQAEDSKFESYFYGCEGDIVSFGQFIRQFCISFDRWGSPKYLLGASYGTPRACGLAEYLSYDCGTNVDGLILLAPALDFSTLIAERDNPLPDSLHIPTFAATAWYHGRGFDHWTLNETVDYARRFMSDYYVPFMFSPNRLSPFEKANFYQHLATLIGLPIETVEKYQGRINEKIYVSEFFARDRKLIGGIDSRYIGQTSAIGTEYIEDPSYRDLRPSFYPSFMHYLQSELDTHVKYPNYIGFNEMVNMFWNYNTFDSPGLPNFMQRLRRVMVSAPETKVFVGLGYFDLRTPLATTEYSLDHLELPEEFYKKFQIEYYEAGHGFIFDLPSLTKFRQDLVQFYQK